jgi:hypothetical protein
MRWTGFTKGISIAKAIKSKICRLFCAMEEIKKGSNLLKPFREAVDPAGIEPATL